MSLWGGGAETILVVLRLAVCCVVVEGQEKAIELLCAELCEPATALGSLLRVRAAAKAVLAHIKCHFGLSISQNLEEAKLL